ncbi:MAG: GAF domain-containing sensor histidine kinase [Anaerolineae bacterium]|nr:GAF domain-containing sensor histidine kinase [Anaerolineae bacterium]
MDKRVLRWLSIILPIGFWLMVILLSGKLFGEKHTPIENAFSLSMVSVGAIAFSTWVFRYIDRREADIKRRATQLAALNSAALALTTELDLGVVLQKVVDISRELVNARYGALGVLSEGEDYFEQFISSGISSDHRATIGPPPVGKGILGMLIKEGRPLRVDSLDKHDRQTGFPPNHPIMKSLIGVPIVSKGKVIGDLYLSDKIAQENVEQPNNQKIISFEDQDQQVLEMFAVQAAIAIENAKLYRQVQELVVLRERERFGMDLHDGIIQSIYAIGLMLDDTQRRMANDTETSSERIVQAIHGLNDVISDIRNYILDLRPQRFQGRDLIQGIQELARAFKANTFMSVNLNLDGVDPEKTNPQQTVEILHIAQEALNNIRKHARASSVDIGLVEQDGMLSLRIEDNGVSIDLEKAEQSKGDGLRNMRERAVALGGNILVENRKQGGTRVLLDVPLVEELEIASQ